MMTIKHTQFNIRLLVALMSLSAVLGFLFVPIVSAQVVPAGCSGSAVAGSPAPGVKCPPTSTAPNDEPKFVKSDCNGSLNQVNNEDTSKDNDCGIIKYLVIFINALSAIVGVVIVIMIIAGGIQYSAASDNPQSAAAAKKRITSAVLALVLFIFMFAFLNYIVPGGVL